MPSAFYVIDKFSELADANIDSLTSGEPIAWNGTQIINADLSEYALLSGATFTGNVNFGSNTITLNGSSITNWPNGTSAAGSSGTVQLSDGSGNLITGNVPISVNTTTGALLVNNSITGTSFDFSSGGSLSCDGTTVTLNHNGGGYLSIQSGKLTTAQIQSRLGLDLLIQRDDGTNMIRANSQSNGGLLKFPFGFTSLSNADMDGNSILNVLGLTSSADTWTLDRYGNLSLSGNLTIDNTIYCNNAIDPSISNQNYGVGITLQASGGSDYGQLRIVSNNGAWADEIQTAYFQIKTGTNNAATFMGGQSGDDLVLDRLQFCSTYTQITDGGFTITPVPSSNLGIVNTTNKVGLSIRGSNEQTDSFVELNAYDYTNIVKIGIDGTYSIADSTGIAYLTKCTSEMDLGNEDDSGDVIYEDGEEVNLGLDINPIYLDTEDSDELETETGEDLGLDLPPIDGFEIISETETPYNDGYGVLHLNSIVLHGQYSSIYGAGGWLQWSENFFGIYDNSGLLTYFDEEGVHSISYYGDGSHLTGIAIPGGSSGDLQYKNDEGGLSGGGPSWTGSFLTVPGNIDLNSSYDIRFNGISDANWRIGIFDAFTTNIVGSSTSLKIVVGQGSGGPDGFAVGQCSGDSYDSIFELCGYNFNAYFRGNIVDGTAVSSIEPINRCLDDENGTHSVIWSSHTDGGSVLRASGNTVVDWGSQLLKATDGTTILDWSSSNGGVIKLEQISSGYSAIDVFCGLFMHGNDLVMHANDGVSGGNIKMDDGSIVDVGSTIAFNPAGYAPPGDDSVGSKIQLWPSSPGSVISTDDSIGIQENAIWFNSDGGDSLSGGFYWYNNAVQTLHLDPFGNLSSDASIVANSFYGDIRELIKTQSQWISNENGINYSGETLDFKINDNYPNVDIASSSDAVVKISRNSGANFDNIKFDTSSNQMDWSNLSLEDWGNVNLFNWSYFPLNCEIKDWGDFDFDDWENCNLDNYDIVINPPSWNVGLLPYSNDFNVWIDNNGTLETMVTINSSGTISATSFIGDGSQLTGIVAVNEWELTDNVISPTSDDYTVSLGSTLNVASSTTSTAFWIAPSTIGNLQAGFLGDGGGETTIDFGLNANQFGSRNTDIIGSIFRLDSRSDIPFFSVRYQPSGGDTEHTPLQITQSGYVLIGTGWGADNNTGINDNDLQIYGSEYIGSNLTVSGQISQGVQSLGDAGNSGVITWAVNNGAIATLTLAGTNETLTLSNIVAGTTYIIQITQGSGGNFTIGTWSNIKWTGGVSPTLSTAEGAIDVITFVSFDGSTLLGIMQNNFS